MPRRLFAFLAPCLLALFGCDAPPAAPTEGGAVRDPAAQAGAQPGEAPAGDASQTDAPLAAAPDEQSPAAPGEVLPGTIQEYRLRVSGSLPGLKTAHTQRLRLRRTQQEGASQLALSVRSPEGELLPEVALRLDERGQPVGGDNEQLLVLLQLALNEEAGVQRTVQLPTGGWLESKPTVSSLAAREIDGRRCAGRQVDAKLRGELASGEPFRGTLACELWQDPESGELVALRAHERLQLRSYGPVELAFALRPLAAEGGTSTGEKKVGWRPSWKAPASPAWGLHQLVGVGFAACCLFVLGCAPRLKGRKTLCLLLCLLVLALPLAPQAHAKSWWHRFTDPTELEIVLTASAAIITGLAAATAAVATAPVWVPVAIGAAGVVGIGAYWSTRTPPIRAGEIYEKTYEPATTRLTYIPMPVVTTNGKTTTTTTVLTPMWIYDDEDYVIKIRDGERTRRLYLTPEEYREVAVGEHYDLDARGGTAVDEHDRRKPSAEEIQTLEDAKARGEDSIELITESHGGMAETLEDSTQER